LKVKKIYGDKGTVACDPVKRVITGDEEATKLLQRQYRSPWQHPFSGDV
jgi:hypothetical protein